MREVDLSTFAAAHRDGAMVIDVREPFEYVTGHVSGAELIQDQQRRRFAGSLRWS